MTSTPTIPPDPPYFGYEKADDVPSDAWRAYAPLTYEVEMLDAVARRINELSRQEPLCDSQRMVKNALLESFGIHFRNLAEFLWPNRLTKKGQRRAPQSTDVVAKHVAPDWTGAEPQDLNDIIDRVNREIGHLTLARRPGKHPDKHWDLEQCIRMLRPLMSVVSHPSTAGRLPDGLTTAVSRLLALVDESGEMREFGMSVNLTTHLGRSS